MPVDSVSWLLPVAREAYKNRADIASAWDRIISLLLGKKTRIAFTGMAGVGKTVLFDHLTRDAYRPGYTPPARSQKSEKGRVNVQRQRLVLSVIPGQEAGPRRDTLDKLFEGDSPVNGVIHVVANGFTSLREAAAKRVLIEDRGVRTLDKFRTLQKQQELEDLRNTCSVLRRALRRHQKPSWMIVAVAKADLFYEEVEEAESYYSPAGSSEFVSILDAFSSKVGTDNFRWTSAPVCAWLENFEWNGDVQPSVLKPDQRDHYLAQFTHLLESYCGD